MSPVCLPYLFSLVLSVLCCEIVLRVHQTLTYIQYIIWVQSMLLHLWDTKMEWHSFWFGWPRLTLKRWWPLTTSSNSEKALAALWDCVSTPLVLYKTEALSCWVWEETAWFYSWFHCWLLHFPFTWLWKHYYNSLSLIIFICNMWLISLLPREGVRITMR